MARFHVVDWTDAYSNAPNIPNGDAWPEAWVKPASDFRAFMSSRSKIDVAYGAHEREVFDLFLPEHNSKGLLIFVHGGFWIRLDKSYWSHLAAGALENGYTVAIPSYPLCPKVRVTEISQSVAKAIEHVAAKVSGPIYLTGHSAGGQIVTRLMSEGSPLKQSTLDRLKHVVSLSGLHDLRPLLNTTLNETIRLDEVETKAESPALLKPIINVPVTCWVGANERSEFVRQNALLANIWRGLGVSTEAIEEPDKHHFDVIDGLARQNTPLISNIFEV